MKLRIPTFLAALALAACVAAGAALAAGTSVSLEVKGEYAKLARAACGKHKLFRAFRRTGTIEFRGFVAPAPAGHFPIRIEVKRCAGGQWRVVASSSFTGKKATGKFKHFAAAAAFAPSRRGRTRFYFYKAKAIYSGTESPEAYFMVAR